MSYFEDSFETSKVLSMKRIFNLTFSNPSLDLDLTLDKIAISDKEKHSLIVNWSIGCEYVHYEKINSIFYLRITLGWVLLVVISIFGR